MAHALMATIHNEHNIGFLDIPSIEPGVDFIETQDKVQQAASAQSSEKPLFSKRVFYVKSPLLKPATGSESDASANTWRAQMLGFKKISDTLNLSASMGNQSLPTTIETPEKLLSAQFARFKFLNQKITQKMNTNPNLFSESYQRLTQPIQDEGFCKEFPKVAGTLCFTAHYLTTLATQQYKEQHEKIGLLLEHVEHTKTLSRAFNQRDSHKAQARRLRNLLQQSKTPGFSQSNASQSTALNRPSPAAPLVFSAHNPALPSDSASATKPAVPQPQSHEKKKKKK